MIRVASRVKAALGAVSLLLFKCAAHNNTNNSTLPNTTHALKKEKNI